MRTISMISRDGTPFDARLPDVSGSEPSVYLFAFHKSGSTLMENMVMTYAHHFNKPIFSLYSAAFVAGIPTHRIDEDAQVCFTPRGMIYSGFRHYPEFNLDLEGQTVFLLVRDPRDMLVSMYYSILKSHTVPKMHSALQNHRKELESQSIDKFVRLKASTLLYKYKQYLKNLDMKNTTCYRYEDVIYEKQSWLEDMVNKMNLPYDQTIINLVAAEFDVFPKKEHQDKHIRQVHPGNHKLKLKAETIEYLNDSLQPFMRQFNYS